MSIFFIFFFFSGFCGLVYQVVWLRVAMAAFGVTTPLVSIVLSVFMAGLALGSWAGGRLVRSFESRSAAFFIALYAVSELIIGLSGVAVAPLLRAGRTLLSDQGASWASPSYYLASAFWVACVMLPACTSMGATFPLAMAAIRAAFRTKSPTSFSYLYLANVSGAMAGALGSAFVFIEILGFFKTLLIAAAFNALIAASALVLAFVWRTRTGDSGHSAIPESGSMAQAPKIAPAGQVGSTIILPLLFTSGLTSLGMEVLWTRQFMPILGPVVYSFAAMLAVYLGATAAGSRWYRICLRPTSAIGERFAIGLATILAGGCAFLPLLATDPQVRIPRQLNSVASIIFGIGPFCAVTGFMTSMLVDQWSRGSPERAGKAYAVNALGCILGPLLAGFVLLPSIGERWALLALALPFLGFALWSFFAIGGSSEEARRARSALGAFLVGASVTSVLLVMLTSDFETLFPERRVRRDYTATSIAIGKGMERTLLINGVGITSLTPITKMMAHLPMAFLPARPRSVLVLCFGMGTSFRSALSWGVPVTVAELVPSVPSLISYFHADGDQLIRSPHATVVIDDARRLLERTPESFDVIIVDPPPPVEAAGSSLLYSTEFYQVALRHLNPGGILQQWLPKADRTVTSAFAQSLRHSFRDVRVFDSTEGGHHFLASASLIDRLSPAALAARLPPAAARDLIEWGPAANAADQFAIVLMREHQIQDLIQGDPTAPLLTDDRPINEYFLLRRLSGH